MIEVTNVHTTHLEDKRKIAVKWGKGTTVIEWSSGVGCRSKAVKTQTMNKRPQYGSIWPHKTI